MYPIFSISFNFPSFFFFLFFFEKNEIKIFEKKTIEKFPKTIQENILANLRRDSQTLAKLRHPSVLRVLYPIEESKTGIRFYPYFHFLSSQFSLFMVIFEVKKIW